MLLHIFNVYYAVHSRHPAVRIGSICILLKKFTLTSRSNHILVRSLVSKNMQKKQRNVVHSANGHSLIRFDGCVWCACKWNFLFEQGVCYLCKIMECQFAKASLLLKNYSQMVFSVKSYVVHWVKPRKKTYPKEVHFF